MIALKKAIWTRISTLGYTVEWGDVPHDTDLPYIVLRPQPGWMPDYTFEEYFTEPRVIRCQIFSTTMEAALGIVRDIEALFVGQDLAVEAGRVLTIRKGGDDCFLEAERDPIYGNIWQGVLDLQIEYQRTVGV